MATVGLEVGEQFRKQRCSDVSVAFRATHHVDLSRRRASHRCRRIRMQLHGVDVRGDGPQPFRGVVDPDQQPVHLEPKLPLCPLQLVQ